MYTRSILRILFIIALLVGIVLQGCSPGLNDEDMTNRMAEGHSNDQPVATAAATMEPAIPITTEHVKYATVNRETVTGYLARPKEAKSPLPGLITIHEWWGLNDNIQAMTRRLAGEGYTVLAVDLYRGQTASSPENARQLFQNVMQNQEAAQSNLRQAYKYLVNERNAPGVGVIGWCFGGGWALRTALLLPKELDAAVIYYGELVTDSMELKKLKMPILGIFAAEDQIISVEKARQFKSVLNLLGKNAEIHIYENASHAFANPSGNQYVPEAAADAWEETTTFLSKYLK
jgi:carboxymethylenebutenolidase